MTSLRVQAVCEPLYKLEIQRIDQTYQAELKVKTNNKQVDNDCLLDSVTICAEPCVGLTGS